MQSDITFDNIYIGHSLEDANKFREETYDIKRPIEDAEEEKSKPKPSEIPQSPSDLVFMDDPVTYIREKLDLFWTLFQKDPVQAIKFMPEVAGGLGGVLALIIAIVVGVLGMGGAAAPSKEDIKKTAQKAKENATDAAAKVQEAAVSGAETARAEVYKRVTRSSGGSE
jgi:calnexin